MVRDIGVFIVIKLVILFGKILHTKNEKHESSYQNVLIVQRLNSEIVSQEIYRIFENP